MSTNGEPTILVTTSSPPEVQQRRCDLTEALGRYLLLRRQLEQLFIDTPQLRETIEHIRKADPQIWGRILV